MTTKSEDARVSPHLVMREASGNTVLDSNPLLICGKIIDADRLQEERAEVRPRPQADIIVAKEEKA